MNTTISSAAETALRKQVERAVRPLRASEQRKLRMREELLAHLTGIYVEELQRHDEPAALAASFERFGSPNELTAELDRSLGSGERWLWLSEHYEQRLDRMWSKADGESLTHFILRSVLKITGLTIALVVVVCGIVWLIEGPPRDPTKFTFIARLLPLMIAGECTALFAALAVDQLTARRTGIRRWLNLLAQALGWSAFLLLVTAAFWWSISHRALTVPEIARVGLSIAATIGGMLCLATFACDYSRRRKQLLDAWRLLELDE
jgi:hypothetical protein